VAFKHIQRREIAMKRFFIQPAMAFLVLAAVLIGSVHAQPAEPVNKPATTKTKKKAAKTAATGHGSRVKFMRGSEETTQERSTRLKRECEGRVNAGACEGYTR
jgi:hypothetical protein